MVGKTGEKITRYTFVHITVGRVRDSLRRLPLVLHLLSDLVRVEDAGDRHLDFPLLVLGRLQGCLQEQDQLGEILE